MYTIKHASRMTKIPSVTIRAWENRYGAIVPNRTQGGHRLYSSQNIEDLLWLRDKTGEGMNISQAGNRLKMISEAKQNTVLPEPTANTTSPHLQEMREKLYQALLSFDTTEADLIVERGFTFFEVDTVFHEIISEVLKRIGDEWEEGKTTIPQEHFATQFAVRRFSQFFRLYRIDQLQPQVVAFCVAGERHEIGLMLFALFLRRQAVNVLYLGCDTPLESISTMLAREQVPWIATSLSNTEKQANVLKWMSEILEQYPDTQFILGGRGFQNLPQEWVKYQLDGYPEKWNEWYNRHFRL